MRNSKFTLFVFGFALALLISCEHKKSDYEESVNGLQSPGFIYLWLLESGYLSGGCEGEYKAKAKFFPEVGKEYTREFSQGGETNFLYVKNSNLLITFTILNSECKFIQSESILCNGLFRSENIIQDKTSPVRPTGQNYYTVNENPIKNTITLNGAVITSLYTSYTVYPPSIKCNIKLKIEYQ